ncbi:MAG: hypothetical protein GEU78_02750 [Actinobacteria bacterium]|nr:hypothetical protein [Actinomycetota bacterium]
MKYRRQMLTVITVGALLVALSPSAAFEAVAATGDNKCYRFRPAEKSFRWKINRSRVRAGKSRLKLDPELGKVARVHARKMAREGSIFHQSSSQLGSRVTRWSTLGENVGVGSTPTSLHKAFMRSPGHKANIMYSAFRNVGVGTVRKNGRLYVTVIFESRLNPGTRLSMPKC